MKLSKNNNNRDLKPKLDTLSPEIQYTVLVINNK